MVLIASLIAIIYLLIISVKAVASIESRQWSGQEAVKREVVIEEVKPYNNGRGRPATKEEMRAGGFIVDTVEDDRGFCLIKRGETYWCDYWGHPPTNL